MTARTDSFTAMLDRAPGSMGHIPVLRCVNHGTDEVMEPAFGDLENECGTATRAHREGAWLIIRHELDIDWQTAFMDELAAEPLVEDVLDWHSPRYSTLRGPFAMHSQRCGKSTLAFEIVSWRKMDKSGSM